ncbi:MAG: HAD family phosphatase [Candidatus Rokubacteria bacterium]|nr:HAD family phosphatase [Candidatus Rokubacteria bacterium]
MTRITGVLFDVGGVVVDSPLHAIARFERAHGIPANAINQAVVGSGDAGAWSRLERGELTLEDFCPAFEADCRVAGVTIDATALMTTIARAAAPRPRMLAAVERLRGAGFRVGALTNNWKRDGATSPVRDHFEVFVESCVVGMRKPDPRLYEHACRVLGVTPAETAFLDDIGRNLKAARALGMTTIKVDDPEQALRDLSAVVGIDLLG